MLPLLSTVGKVAGAAGDIIDPVQIAAKAAKLPLEAAAVVREQDCSSHHGGRFA